MADALRLSKNPPYPFLLLREPNPHTAAAIGKLLSGHRKEMLGGMGILLICSPPLAPWGCGTWGPLEILKGSRLLTQAGEKDKRAHVLEDITQLPLNRSWTRLPMESLSSEIINPRI